jgi:predicted MFS family arabinose efflux permease
MYYGWRVVGGAFIAQFFVVGFFTYALSLLIEPVRQDFGVSLEQVMYSLTAATLLGLFLQPAGGILVDRFSVRTVMAVGAVLYAAGLFALARASGIGHYILAFALTMSVSNALVGTIASSAVISRWFTASRGRALGIAALGTSVGGVLIPVLVSHWLDTSGWRGAVHNLGLGVTVILLPAVLLLVRSRPDDVGLAPEASDPDAPPQPTAGEGLGAIVRNPTFWLLGFSLGILFSVYSAILSNLTPYALNLGSSKEQAAALIMAVAIAGFIGKVSFGLAADRFSLRSALWAAQLLVGSAFLVLATEPGHAGMLVGSFVLGLAAGGMLPVWGSLMAHVFGLANYGRAMGLMGPIITLCVMPGFAVVGRMVDTVGSYTPTLYLFAGLCLVSAALLLPMRLPRHQVTYK